MTPIGWLLTIYASSIAAFALVFKKYYMPTPPPIPLPVPEPLPTPTPPPMPTPSSKVYNCAKLLMGKHLTLDSSVPDELGCAEALSYVLTRAGYKLPPKGIPGVNAMIAWMLGAGFREFDVPHAGCIITAHRPDYNDTNYAHIGVVMNQGICSNSSANGLWQENYTMRTWRDYFVSRGAAEVRYFAPV